MGNLLFDSQPLVIIPEIATAIGLNESIVLQQIHYWLKTNQQTGRNKRDGYCWVYNTYEEWQKQFPFWSVATVKRIIASLEKEGWLISANYNRMKIDRTKWYRIDYDKLETLNSPPKYQIDTMDGSICADAKAQYDPTNTRDYTENTTEISKKNKGFLPHGEKTACFSFSDYREHWEVDEDKIEVVEYYLQRYREYQGKEHPRLKEEQWDRVLDSLFSVEDAIGRVHDDLTVENLVLMIDKHFKTKYRNCDYNILHFIEEGVKSKRFFEELY